jgi:hypothetical protein
MKARCLLAFSLLLRLSAFALDREAFTPTSYDLQVELDPAQHRLAVQGKIDLRNNSQLPQKIAVLQISSSLSWHSINASDTALQFVAQPYRTDIDHTGALSEAIITLPQSVAPKGIVELEVSYEGVIVLDATRLTSIGTPEAQANSSDWDQIGPQFTAVRGVGYVAWYPIATESADLAEAGGLSNVLARWKSREAASKMHLRIGMSEDNGEQLPELLANEASCMVMYEAVDRPQRVSADCTYESSGFVAPTFVLAHYEHLERPSIEVHFLPGHEALAVKYADAAEKVIPFIAEWFGPPRAKIRTADLFNPEAAPFESGSFLLTPLSSADAKLMDLAAAHQLAHAAFSSPRPWIDEGATHFAQALYIEHLNGRRAALEYMKTHRSVVKEEEKPTGSASKHELSHSLIDSFREDLDRTKAMYVWWMLRDMLGDVALKKIIAAYRPGDDKDPAYLPRLIQSQTQRNLDWFFDDWVNGDHSLPNLHVASAFARKTTADAYLLTVTVENSGGSGAEVPVRVRFAGGELVRRVEVHANASGVVRVELPKTPQEVIVNDDSVPESGEGGKPFEINSAADDNK